MKSMESSKEYLADFPPGPLDTYRKRASFNWKLMKLLIEGEELLDFKMQLWKKMEDDPLFHHSTLTPSIDEFRRLTALRCKRIRSYNLKTEKDMWHNVTKDLVVIPALDIYDPSLALKYFIQFVFFVRSIQDLGTEKHEHFMKSAENEEINGCYALTEVTHGSNAKKIRTTATFDSKTQEFIIHSEDFEAGKFWIGSLGKSTTHATVFAQLITPDGMNHGLHAFITPIRDPETMLPYPGVLVREMSEKLGMNGIDNGFAIFTNYRIPRDNLLDRMGTVTPDGRYISPFENPQQRFAASLSTILFGRTGINFTSTNSLSKAVVIAIRYSAVRRQFGPSHGEELPIIEYQLQQWRLFPYLAASYALKMFTSSSTYSLTKFFNGIRSNADKEEMAGLGLELHVLQSSAKALTSWTAQCGIQECRESCGGNGYLKCSGFGTLRDDNDANCTLEGDNNVLTQQTSNFLLQLWAAGNEFTSPLGSVDFLCNKTASRKFTATNVQEISNPEAILEAYDSLLLWLLETTLNLYREHRKIKDSFTSRNDSQVYSARTLSMAYIERFVIKTFWKFCNSVNSNGGEKATLQKLCSLYGLWCLEKHLGTLYECGYAEGPQPTRLIRDSIIQICQQLKPDAVALADAIAPPDFILNSVIGKSDGKLYQNLRAFSLQNPTMTEHPESWTAGEFKAKL